jgi:hypothetical protein
MYGDEQGTDLAHGAHGEAHSYIGGNLGDPHLSFRDPFVFFLHSNIDRLWAMWQRDPAHPERLDPAQVYDTEEGSTVMAGREDVEVGEPYWGIQLPLAPWAGFAAQTLMKDSWPVRPWAAPENEQSLPGNNQISTDITLVIPPSYDTAPHSSYVIANQDTFSTSQAAVSLTFSQGIIVIYDGFQPREVGTPTASNPAFTFTIGGAPVASMSVANPQVLFEDPAGAPDVPQRISITYDVVFADTSAFPAVSGGETAVTMQVALNYTVGGTTVNATDKTSALLLLVNQPSPYMLDIDSTIPPPGPPNPYWLSTDTRVFNVKQGDSVFGVMQQPNDPLGFIKALVTAFNAAPDNSSHPFLTQLTTDETAPQGLIELTPTAGGTPVFNYAIAKIRYRGDVPANNVSVFFRAFKTMVSALDYDQTSGTSLSGNYRRSGNTSGSVPLLGLQSNEIASIPFFAAARVDTSPGGKAMTAQTEDPMNAQISFAGTGADEVIYCGVWLDVNDTVNKRFPLDPGSDPGGVNGPYQNTRFTIQQLMTGVALLPGRRDLFLAARSHHRSDSAERDSGFQRPSGAAQPIARYIRQSRLAVHPHRAAIFRSRLPWQGAHHARCVPVHHSGQHRSRDIAHGHPQSLGSSLHPRDHSAREPLVPDLHALAGRPGHKSYRAWRRSDQDPALAHRRRPTRAVSCARAMRSQTA